MHKLVKLALAAGACAVLTGCPIATTVTGTVTTGVGGIFVQTITSGTTLSESDTYYVFAGASITVRYDNGKTCTFTGETSFIPGNDGSVCQQKDNEDKKKQDNNDDNQDKNDDNQDQQDAGQEQGQPSNGGTNTSSGINAPPVNPTTNPWNSQGGPGGFSGLPVVATGVPTYSRIMSVINNPILTTTLSAIGAAAVVKEVHDQTNGSDKPDEPVSK